MTKRINCISCLWSICLLIIMPTAWANNFYLGLGTGDTLFLRDTHVQFNALNTRIYASDSAFSGNVIGGYHYYFGNTRTMLGVELNADYANTSIDSTYRYSSNNSQPISLYTSETYRGSTGLLFQAGYFIQQATLLALDLGIARGFFTTDYTNNFHSTHASNGFRYGVSLQVPFAGNFYARTDLTQTRYQAWSTHQASTSLSASERPNTTQLLVSVVWQFDDNGHTPTIASNSVGSVSQYIRNIRKNAQPT